MHSGVQNIYCCVFVSLACPSVFSNVYRKSFFFNVGKYVISVMYLSPILYIKMCIPFELSKVTGQDNTSQE